MTAEARYRGRTNADSSAYQRSQYPSSSSGPSWDSPTVATESENDAILKALLKDVRGIKRSVTEVNQEVKAHISLLDQLLPAMQGANERVKGTVRKLQEVSGLSSAWHVWLLVLVAFVVFVYLVLLLKSRGR